MAESITTSEDRHSRPLKRRALSPASKQAANVEALFANPTAALKEPRDPRESSGLAPPPEVVNNVQGSSAGAGSGEFHVYKASRRREYERLRVMEEESTREEETAKFEARKAEARRRDEQKTGKNRARREKARMRKEGKGGGDGGKGKLKANGAGMNGVAAGGDGDEMMDGTPVAEEQGIVINDDD